MNCPKCDGGTRLLLLGLVLIGLRIAWHLKGSGPEYSTSSIPNELEGEPLFV